MDDLDEFSFPLGRGEGWRKVDDQWEAPKELTDKLDAFDRMHQRGASEAATTPFPRFAPESS